MLYADDHRERREGCQPRKKPCNACRLSGCSLSYPPISNNQKKIHGRFEHILFRRSPYHIFERRVPTWCGGRMTTLASCLMTTGINESFSRTMDSLFSLYLFRIQMLGQALKFQMLVYAYKWNRYYLRNPYPST